jgi:hypothetical protein
MSLMALAFLVNYLRSPKELLNGQVWAEEGTTYLRYAWNAGPIRAFFAPHMGYYSLLDNAMTVIAARLLPLSAAAYLFSWTALSVRLLASYLIVTSQYLVNFRSRIIALLSFLVATGSLEGWLSLEYSQFCLPICVSMILIATEARWQSKGSSIFRYAVLLLSGLTGVTSCMLLPLFWVKAALQRTKGAFIECGVLTLTTIIQLAFIIPYLRVGDNHGLALQFRFAGPVLLQRILLLPLFTNRAIFYTNHLFATHPLVAIWGGWLCLFAGILLLFRLSRPYGTAPRFLIAAAVLSSSVNWLGCPVCSDPGLFSLNPVTASRYFYPADALIALAASFMFVLSPDRRRRIMTGSLLFLVLCSGVLQYPHGIGWLNNSRAEWRPQVQAWKRDASTPIYISPSFWPGVLQLPHEHADAPLPVAIYDTARLPPRR